MADRIITDEVPPMKCPHCGDSVEEHGIGLVHTGPVALIFHEDPGCRKILTGIAAFRLGL